MVAVVIISIVITALLQMMGNSTNIFSKIKTDSDTGQYISLLLDSKDYGFENKRIGLDRLTETFELDRDLQRRLKNMKAKVIYTELQTIDMSEFDEESDEQESDDAKEEVSSALVFEIGKTTLKFKQSSSSLIRLRLQ